MPATFNYTIATVDQNSFMFSYLWKDEYIYVWISQAS